MSYLNTEFKNELSKKRKTSEVKKTLTPKCFHGIDKNVVMKRHTVSANP